MLESDAVRGNETEFFFFFLGLLLLFGARIDMSLKLFVLKV